MHLDVRSEPVSTYSLPCRCCKPLALNRGGRDDPKGSFLSICRYLEDLVESSLRCNGCRPEVHQGSEGSHMAYGSQRGASAL